MQDPIAEAECPASIELAAEVSAAAECCSPELDDVPLLDDLQPELGAGADGSAVSDPMEQIASGSANCGDQTDERERRNREYVAECLCHFNPLSANIGACSGGLIAVHHAVETVIMKSAEFATLDDLPKLVAAGGLLVRIMKQVEAQEKFLRELENDAPPELRIRRCDPSEDLST